MNAPLQLVVFMLDGQRYALSLGNIGRIVRAVAVTPLPNAPAIVLGAINVQGTIIPVLNIRRRLQLPEREIGVTDQFVIAQTCQRTVALVVDEAQGVIEHEPDAITSASRITPGLKHLQGVVALDDDLVLIHDLEKFLSLDEARTLDDAMERARSC